MTNERRDRSIGGSSPAKRPPHLDVEVVERASVAAEVAAQLRRRGVSLSGNESDEELVNLLDAVESFEEVVERNGGDLLVDEPLDGARAPLQPDDAVFVLPTRGVDESVPSFISRIDAARHRAAGHHLPE